MPEAARLDPRLTEAVASRLALVALANVQQEYPNHLQHLMNGPQDAQPPHALHPLFYGSYDWHSCVHMHWTLVRCLRLFPQLSEAVDIAAYFERQWTDSAVAAEIAYLHAAGRAGFERPYGWAWLFKLQAELQALAASHAGAARWARTLAPLTEVLVQRLLEFLPKATHPVRPGTHANSAFALLLAHEYAVAAQHPSLRRAVASKAIAWYGHDTHYPARYEPSGEDFLSAGLVEAVLMQAALADDCDYADWWNLFCPSEADAASWLTPVAVTDRADGKLAHFDGLNLSRAWCWKRLLPYVDANWRPAVARGIDAHLEASLPNAIEGDYAGTHWLASFALLALGPAAA